MPRFGPAAKAARAKEKELEAARVAKEKRDATPTIKALPKAACVPLILASHSLCEM